MHEVESRRQRTMNTASHQSSMAGLAAVGRLYIVVAGTSIAGIWLADVCGPESAGLQHAELILIPVSAVVIHFGYGFMQS